MPAHRSLGQTQAGLPAGVGMSNVGGLYAFLFNGFLLFALFVSKEDFLSTRNALCSMRYA
jgi:hypothetical protein